MRIAVLALQGAFIEHEQVLQRLGVETFELRQLKDWQQPKDGLILPGGESTVQMRLLNELGLLGPLRQAILDGLPVGHSRRYARLRHLCRHDPALRRSSGHDAHPGAS